MKYTITNIKAREIISSIGNATVRAAVCINDEAWAWADMPLGVCNCKAEAKVILDGDQRLRGSGVTKAVANVMNTIRPKLIGMEVADQEALDQTLLELDGTPDKSNLGANALFPVSFAAAKAVAAAKGLPLYLHLNNEAHLLPVPWVSILNGGWQGANDMDTQDIVLLPTKASTFAEAVDYLVEAFHCLKEVLAEKHGIYSTNFTAEGGFSPPMGRTTDVLELLEEAMRRAGSEDSGAIQIDVAASTFFDTAANRYIFEGGSLTGEEMVGWTVSVSQEHPRVKFWEDVIEQNDFDNFKSLVAKLPQHLIIGDDIFGTDLSRIQKGFEYGAVNSALCKIAQPGTLTEAVKAGRYTAKNGTLVMSVRVAETEDDGICDVSLALGAPHIKLGGLQGSERLAKYNRLVEIEKELGSKARYAGNIIDFENVAADLSG